MLKTIESPNISDIDNKSISRLIDNDEIEELIRKSFAPYSHWEKIKHWPMPEGIKPIEVWAVIKKVVRADFGRRKSIITDEKGKQFSWIPWLPGLEELLHQIDMKLGGNLSVDNQFGEDMQNRLLSRGVMEEAIASSQLEGAHTSRKAAKQIILEGRKPANKDEHMIVNNYEAMRLIETNLKNGKLNEDILLELHRVLTKNTLEESDIARYRKDEDDIVVGGVNNSEIYHIPPSEEFVRKEIKKLIGYANNDTKDSSFIHPIIKAIIIHFWIGYLHPFVDGNGRMARALFYWYLLREGYWVFSYLPLSKVIKDSPAQYRDAYMYSEQDNNDLTYFIDYNIRKITQAIREFEEYAERKHKENTKISKVAKEKFHLNDRQTQLLRYFYKNKDASTSITTHMKIYGVSRMTASKDLKILEGKKLIRPKRVGRNIYYYATDSVLGLFD